MLWTAGRHIGKHTLTIPQKNLPNSASQANRLSGRIFTIDRAHQTRWSALPPVLKGLDLPSY